MSRLVTTIRWREYPKEKPSIRGEYSVLYDNEKEGELASLYYKDGAWYSTNEYGTTNMDFDHSDYVMAFALPEDITTEDEA